MFTREEFAAECANKRDLRYAYLLNNVSGYIEIFVNHTDSASTPANSIDGGPRE
jgi:hypothetical protein